MITHFSHSSNIKNIFIRKVILVIDKIVKM